MGTLHLSGGSKRMPDTSSQAVVPSRGPVIIRILLANWLRSSVSLLHLLKPDKDDFSGSKI
jgi:hypothetical protein